jgi:hypothetical protein
LNPNLRTLIAAAKEWHDAGTITSLATIIATLGKLTKKCARSTLALQLLCVTPHDVDSDLTPKATVVTG